jgi:hypothetical protein
MMTDLLTEPVSTIVRERGTVHTQPVGGKAASVLELRAVAQQGRAEKGSEPERLLRRHAVAYSNKGGRRR